ncbi:MAG: nitronate monooxygenase, partial [bacterium]|nr:nitronate monooxygenase [bacterium]
MIKTILTDTFSLRYPLINAPMANIARGRLARAVSQAGGLGMIGVGSGDSAEFVAAEAQTARGADGQSPFGIGLMAWALEGKPELLTAAIEARPALISLSFGDLRASVARVRDAGIRVASQVQSREDALRAAEAGVDFIVAQGTEAGGHTGQVGTLPLLQIVLDAVSLPVIVAGGIASARGVAAVLAAGAQGAWIGTAFLASPESETHERARERVLRARETDTVLTSLFDRAQGLAWPSRYPGRALRNRFTERWHGHEQELLGDH